MTLPRIGLLGGMGPAATILLQQRLLDAVKVESDSGHLPLYIDMNPQVPSRIDYLVHGYGESPGPVLARMARGLEGQGADVIVMPCCTAHHFADEIVRSVSVPFLNMVELTVSDIANRVPPGSDIGVLASPATMKIGLFENQLQLCKLKARYPHDMGAMLVAIETIKKSGPTPKVLGVVQSAIRELEDAQVGAIIVGCSEFSLIARQLESVLPVVDAMDVLTQAIVSATAMITR